jgi:beta-glucosidase
MKNINTACFSFSFLAKKEQKKKLQIKPKTEFVAELMARMTVDEKIGQLNLPTSGDITTGAANSSDVAKILKKAKLADYLISSRLKRLKKYRIAVEKAD